MFSNFATFFKKTLTFFVNLICKITEILLLPQFGIVQATNPSCLHYPELG